MSKYKPAFDFADSVYIKLNEKNSSLFIEELVDLLPENSKRTDRGKIELVRDYLCGDIRF